MRHPAAHASPALVFGADITALAVVRALGRNGVPAYVAGERTGLVDRSRWYRRAPGAPIREDGDVDALTRYLAELPFERAVAFPCTDMWAVALAAQPAETTDRFPASIAAPPALGTLVDKARFAAAAERLGVPIPRTVHAAGPHDLGELEDADLTALFFKPVDSQAFSRRFGVKAMRARGRFEAIEVLDRVAGAGLEVLLQEYVPGPTTDHIFIDGYVDQGGTMRGCLAYRRLRMHPPEFGNSTMAVTIPLAEVAAAHESLLRLFDGLDYSGLFDAEFKHDSRDGEFKLLEVNARPWWNLEIAGAAGLDLCGIAYRDALGLPLPRSTGYRVGRTWVHPLPDLRAWGAARRHGAPVGPHPLRAFFGGANAIFSRDDPRPAAGELVRLARHAAAWGAVEADVDHALGSSLDERRRAERRAVRWLSRGAREGRSCRTRPAAWPGRSAARACGRSTSGSGSVGSRVMNASTSAILSPRRVSTLSANGR